MKREHYQRIPSLRAYIIIEQDRVHVELYLRVESNWDYKVFQNLDTAIRLRCINCELPLSQIYGGINTLWAEAG